MDTPTDPDDLLLALLGEMLKLAQGTELSREDRARLTVAGAAIFTVLSTDPWAEKAYLAAVEGDMALGLGEDLCQALAVAMPPNTVCH